MRSPIIGSSIHFGYPTATGTKCNAAIVTATAHPPESPKEEAARKKFQIIDAAVFDANGSQCTLRAMYNICNKEIVERLMPDEVSTAPTWHWPDMCEES